jgi:hypothetical protein
MSDGPPIIVRRTFWSRWKERWLRRREEKEQRRVRRQNDSDRPKREGDQRLKSEW